MTFQTATTLHHIDCYSNIIREQVNGGHVPMLIGINKCHFNYSENMLTVAVEMTSGIQKERTFYVPIIENDRGAIFFGRNCIIIFVTTFVLAYCMSYEMQYRTYDGIEKLNVRATINLLGQILSDSVES